MDGAIEIRNDYNWIDFNYDTVPVQQLFDADRGFVLNDTDSVITVDGVNVDPYTVVNPNDTVNSYDGTSVDRIHFFSHLEMIMLWLEQMAMITCSIGRKETMC